jgi:glucose-6-phosphate isomerase
MASDGDAGAVLVTSERKLGDLRDLFARPDAMSDRDADRVVYRTVVWQPAPEGTPDALQFGTSFIEPGRVGDEYFMTRGHRHAVRERPEIYWGIRGTGALILQNDDGRCWAEKVSPGSLHHIFGHVAHRLVNVGDDVLAVAACWPLDAGHDYASLGAAGFGRRVVRGPDGAPMLAGA